MIPLDKENISNNSAYNLSLNFIISLFLLGFFISFEININKYSINISYIDCLTIILSIFLLLNTAMINSKLFLMFTLYSLIMLVSLIIGYVNFNSNIWAYGNKFIGWFVLCAYAFTGMYIGKNILISRNGYLLKLFTFTGLLILLCSLCYYCVKLIDIKNFKFNHLEIFNVFSPNRNAFAYILCIMHGALIVYSKEWFNNNIKSAVIQGLVAISICLTFSRTGFIAIIVLNILSFILNIMPLKNASIITSIGLLLMQIIPNNSLNWRLTYCSSWIERKKTILEGLTMFIDKPIFGQGLGAYINKEITENNIPLIIHNTYVWILAEFGIVGFIAFLIGLILILNKISQLYQNTHTKNLGLMLLFLVVNFLLFACAHEIFYQRITWFLIPYIIANADLASEPSPIFSTTN
jgi:O-antigen ligase